MAPILLRKKFLSVGGNPTSAFIAWRLQATNACDVTVVWQNGFDHASQYGFTFKSQLYGNERFKPRHVVRATEDAPSLKEMPFDYVILSPSPLPPLSELANLIEAVITPHHTCIVVNASTLLGLESFLEERFPTNVVLSLVCYHDIYQIGSCEFELQSSSNMMVGQAAKSEAASVSSLPSDMAQALAITLQTGQVDCHVSPNIRQEQYDLLIGPLAFYPLTVIFETPHYSALLDKAGVPQLVSGLLDELLQLAKAYGCEFPPEYKEKTMEKMSASNRERNEMWQDFIARRPLDVEATLGSPVRLSHDAGLSLPRIEALYAILHNVDITNRDKSRGEAATIQSMYPNNVNRMSPQAPPPPRSANGMLLGAPNGTPNGVPNGSMSGNGMPLPLPQNRFRGPPPRGPPSMRRPSPGMNGNFSNGYGRPSPGSGHPLSGQASLRASGEGNDVEELSHLYPYDEVPIPEGGEVSYTPDAHELSLREREYQLRQRELILREQEMRMRRGGSAPPSRRGPPPSRNGVYDGDDDDDFVDPSIPVGRAMIDPDNFDMMSITSRKNRKAPKPSQQIRNPDFDSMPPRSHSSARFRLTSGRNRSSQLLHQMPPLMQGDILDDPLLGFTSNRYGAVDRGTMQAESRSNSLTAARLDELQHYPPHGPGLLHRTSQAPAMPYNPSMRGGNGRPSPPRGNMPPGGVALHPGHPASRRPLPSNGVAPQPSPRFPSGPMSAGGPLRTALEPPPPRTKESRSVTGSASASAGSGESANLDFEASAHSSQSSLGPRPPIGVR